MADMDISIYDSKPFEFVVQGVSFYIHRALLGQISAPLERLINGGMSEAQKGQALMKDEDKATFTRFCQWAYTGIYHAEPYTKRPKNEMLSVEVGDDVTSTPPMSDNGLPRPRIRKPGHGYHGPSVDPKPRKEVLKETFLRLRFYQPQDQRSNWVPRQNKGAEDDYTETFLSHARLYMFAEKFDIQPLKRLILHNIHQTLAIFTLGPECVGDVVALLAFVYDNIIPAPDEHEPMRKMLNQYVGYEMEIMVNAPVFRELLARDQDFLEDFCSEVAKRMG